MNLIIEKTKQILAFILKKKYLFGILAVVLVLVGYLVLKPAKTTLRTVEAKIGKVEQIVSSTGRVEKSDKVDLGFNSSGRIAWVGVKVGDRVKSGQGLAMIESGDLLAQKSSALAGVESAKARLDQLLAGVREEDLNVSRINYENALKVYSDVAAKNSVDVIRSSLNVAINAMVSYTDAQYLYFNGNNIEAFDVRDNKEKILNKLFDQPNMGSAGSWYFINLRTGLVGRLDALSDNQDILKAQTLLLDTKSVLYDIKNSLDLLYARMSGLSSSETERSKILTAKNNVLTQISAINNQDQAVLTAKNNVDSTYAQLNLRKAPPTQYEIEIAKAQLGQAQASLALIESQITRNVIVSPINGTVSLVDIKKGEIASMGKSQISVIGDSGYEITVNIPEIDISKIKVGNLGKVYLDAFGQDVIWDASVTSISPAEKMIDGVPTYEAKLAFASDNDPRIKTGLTANLEIVNEIRNNVLQIPARAVYQKDGQKFVKVVANNDDDLSQTRFANLSVATQNKQTTIYEAPITTGLRGSDGKVQVTSGIEEGDNILIQ